MCLYSVPGTVGSLSSIMDTTWAVISWSVPRYIPQAYPIIRYEIGCYAASQSHNCFDLMVNTDRLTLKTINVSITNTFINTTGLSDSTCYIFGVRAYTINGPGKWRVIANETLELPLQPSAAVSVSPSLLCKYYCLLFIYHLMLSQQSVQVPLHAHAVMSVAVMTLHLVC